MTEGVPFHGEFSSADASALSEASSRLTLYGAGATAALTLTAEDQVLVTDLTVTSGGTNLTVQVYDGADATVSTGELLFKAVIPTNTVQTKPLATPHRCQKGTYPKVKASGAGQVDVIVHGTITRRGA